MTEPKGLRRIVRWSVQPDRKSVAEAYAGASLAGVASLRRQLAHVFDELATQTRPGYVPDWSGLDALLGALGNAEIGGTPA